MKKVILAIFLFVAALAQAQNTTSVTATNITDINGVKLVNGQICFLGTDNNDIPFAFSIGGGGQALTRQKCVSVINGVMGALSVPNPANTAPAGILYRITVKDSSNNQQVLQYSKVSFSGASFNFDLYSATGGNVLPPTGGTVNGPLTVNGNLSVTGSFAPGSISTGAITSTGGITFTGNTALPAATGTNLTIAGAFGTPVLGAIYCGDGTGWRLEFRKRVASADTALGKCNDTGVFQFNQLQIGTDTTMSAAPRSSWSVFLPSGNQSLANQPFAAMILDKAITVTRINAYLISAVSGCSTQPTFQVTDLTTSGTITIANTVFANDSGAISVNYAAGATIFIRSGVVGVGCGGGGNTASNIGLTVEYKMQ